MTPKNDTIAAIMKINQTANPTFLAEFPNRELDDYLNRLRQRSRPASSDDHRYPHRSQLVAAVTRHHAG
jgi:hypothetical protein